jgi:hypothetical protein
VKKKIGTIRRNIVVQQVEERNGKMMIKEEVEKQPVDDGQ